MDYLMIIHVAEEGGYWAEFPALPGCYTQGETVEEVLQDAPAAVQSHLKALLEFGQQIPTERPLIAMIQSPEPSIV